MPPVLVSTLSDYFGSMWLAFRAAEDRNAHTMTALELIRNGTSQFRSKFGIDQRA